ncbi:putative two-component histidine kinase [Mobilicoccus pelagius NBRC 104925]|uniref:Putative two-component histidine kinase n=2 Tax=Mobilicoccus TaxID=984996 RepID=H5UQQ8_9MICO|nr:putative two-component histidine kinase [Mobilicoccus pelagius NBRC 104925]
MPDHGPDGPDARRGRHITVDHGTGVPHDAAEGHDGRGAEGVDVGGGRIDARHDRERRRLEAYCRWSLHIVLLFAALLEVSGCLAVSVELRAAGRAAAAVLAGVVAAVSGMWIVAGVVLVELVTRERRSPRWLVGAFTVLWPVVTVATTCLLPSDTVTRAGAASALAYGPLTLVLGASLAVLLWRVRVAVVCVVVGLVALFTLAVLGPAHVSTTTAATLVVFTAAFSVFVVPSAALTRWMIDVVRRLWRAQQVAADLAVAEERLRFSRDLHDVFGRTLSTVAIKSELAAELARRGDERAVAQMAAVRDLAHDALAEVRGVVRGYRRIDLAEEIAGARSLLRAAGIPTTVRGVDDPLLACARTAIGEEGADALAWVVREGVTNVLRHGQASSVALDLVVDGTAVVLTLENASTRHLAPADGLGSGLLGLRERLEAVGGTLRAGPSDDGRGYLVHTRVPATEVESVGHVDGLGGVRRHRG